MWLDLNSAFATAEQQAHPTLRGRPLAITNRISKACCIIAASHEAKALGIKVGSRRNEALAICPSLILLETDPPKYHHIYQKLFAIMKSYTPNVKMKSIDEGILDFHHTPHQGQTTTLIKIAHEIKSKVQKNIGDYITINIGIAPNRFLAKTAASLHKPDGLDIITHHNLIATYKTLALEDLSGIATAYSNRLRVHNITTPLAFLSTPENVLRKTVFRSICGTYWHKRLRGYEVDAHPTKLSIVGRQWVVKTPTNNEDYLRSCLHYLTETTAIKLRHKNQAARGVCIWMHFCEGGGFQDKKTFKSPCYTDAAIWERVTSLFHNRPKLPRVKSLGIYLYHLEPSTRSQTTLLDDIQKADYLTTAIDEINDSYGLFTIHSADSLTGKSIIKQKIPFGGTDYFTLLLKSA
jgi:DNA polymerase-4